MFWEQIVVGSIPVILANIRYIIKVHLTQCNYYIPNISPFKEVIKIRICQNNLIVNYRKFKVKFDNGGERSYIMSRENKGIFFYNVYNGNEKLGFTRIGLNQKFYEKFPCGQAYTINN